MTEINLPQRIISNTESPEKIMPKSFKNILICSDKTSGELSNLIMDFKQQSTKMITQAKALVNLNIDELINSVISFAETKKTDYIIAVGSGELISAIGRIASEFGLDFTAIPVCSFFSTDTKFKMPLEIVLNDSYIISSESMTVAYDSMAALALSADVLINSPDEYIRKSAEDTFSVILKNTVPSFRGEISARLKLMKSMFAAQLTYMNSGTSISLLREVCGFFSEFGYPEKSVAAVCIPNILECADINKEESFARLARENRCALYGDPDRIAAEKLTEKIRSIQALIGISRNVRSFGIDEEKYIKKSEKTDINKKLLDLCYYGSFRFMKL